MAKVKIPKRVAGIKVPKKVRKKAKKAIRAAESPVMREFAAAAIGAVAERRASRAAAHATGNGREVGRTVRIDGDQLAETIRTAAMDGLRRFLEGFDEGMRDLSRSSSDREESDEPVSAGRKPAASRRPGASGG